ARSRAATPPYSKGAASLGTSGRRTCARTDNDERQIAGSEVRAGDTLHIVARDREKFIQIGVDLVDGRVEGAIVVQLFRLSERGLTVRDEAGTQHVLRLLELGREIGRASSSKRAGP